MQFKSLFITSMMIISFNLLLAVQPSHGLSSTNNRFQANGVHDKVVSSHKYDFKSSAFHKLNNKKSTSGIFFYRKSLGHTIMAACVLAVISGSVSYLIASLVSPASYYSASEPLNRLGSFANTAAAA
jgi:hypothetical protein